MKRSHWHKLGFVVVMAVVGLIAKRDVMAGNYYGAHCSLHITTDGSGGTGACANRGEIDYDKSWDCEGSCDCYCGYFITDYQCSDVVSRVCDAFGDYDYCYELWADCDGNMPCCDDGAFCGDENYCVPAARPSEPAHQ